MQQKLLLSENFKTNFASLTKDSHMVAWSTSLYPVVIIVCIYLTWALAWIGLGHQPRLHYLDDPDSINIFVDLLRSFTFFMIIGSYAVLLINIVFTLTATIHGFLKKAKGTLLLFILPIITWSLAYFMFIRDPMNVIQWFWN